MSYKNITEINIVITLPIHKNEITDRHRFSSTDKQINFTLWQHCPYTSKIHQLLLWAYFLVRHHLVSSISLRKIVRVKVQTESFLAVLQNWVSLARFLLCHGLWWEHIPSVVVFCSLYIRYGLFRHPVNTTCNPLLIIRRLTSSSLQGDWLYNIYKHPAQA